MTAIFQQLRAYQWVKNLLLFVPLILAHQVNDTSAWLTLLVCFVAFSLAASAIYTVNDLSDIESDKLHPRKKGRPIPSGRLTPRSAIYLAVLLLATSAIISVAFAPLEFSYWLLTYVVATSLYTFLLKKVVLLDVLLLAGLYTLRIAAGGSAVHVEVSPWLLAFSLFIFTSLAFLKRYTELMDTIEREGRVVSGRGYRVGDADFVRVVGPSLGLLAVFVFTLYLNSEEVTRLYTAPGRLWFVAPVLLYWVARMWLKGHRGHMHDDPILYSVKDPASYVVVLLIGIILYTAGPV